jgi:methylenetetrahydrofolate reductase (NADPH)
MTRIAELLSTPVGQRATRPTVSFEFFPPKTFGGWLTLGRTISRLAPLGPSFVSVTYGAGGSTRATTHDLVAWVRAETEVSPMAHLTCVGHTKAEITAILDGYREAGIENILALGGDPPKGATDLPPSDFTYASELLDLVADYGGFSIGVAAHPEGHPRSPDLATDRRHLAAKLERADFAVSQFFFDAEHYLRLVDDLAALGCHKPVVPGIMPVTNLSSVKRMAELSGAAFPQWLADRLSEGGDDAEAVRKIGIEAASELCSTLLDAGAPGLHLYTLNRSTATTEIVTNLNLPAH